jgi:uncharacterized membrane-anchored protein YhcB (DUF1043 family)
VTPRERRDMPWLLVAFGIVVLVIIGGVFLRWH